MAKKTTTHKKRRKTTKAAAKPSKSNGNGKQPVEELTITTSEEYLRRQKELNARKLCSDCGRNIEKRSKAHLPANNYEKSVCIPCFERRTFGRKVRA